MQIRHPVASLAATIVITLILLAVGAVLCGYKHGINMTAMPSFGKTQTDQTIWQTAAFLYDARGITQQRYETLVHGSK